MTSKLFLEGKKKKYKKIITLSLFAKESNKSQKAVVVVHFYLQGITIPLNKDVLTGFALNPVREGASARVVREGAKRRVPVTARAFEGGFRTDTLLFYCCTEKNQNE